MAKLILLRHLKSQWNKDNRFAGWTDGPTTKEDSTRVKDLANNVFKNRIDVVYTSSLFRNQYTVAKIFEMIDIKYPFFIHIDKGKMKDWGNFTDISENDIPCYVTEKLNERYYGILQGLNKEEIINKYGEKKVNLWRRSYDIAPPKAESLRDVYKRVIPFFKKYVEKDLKANKNIVVVASHNSLRAIVKYIENISNEKIIDVEFPFGGMLEYEFDKNLNLKSDKHFKSI